MRYNHRLPIGVYFILSIHSDPSDKLLRLCNDKQGQNVVFNML